MKRITNLFTKICSIENLILADKKARKGKLRSYGVLRHSKNQEENIRRLHELLINEKFKTSQYQTFKIYDPKEREIYRLPYYPDRIVHHAIMNILESLWLSLFTKDTYSCIKGRGIHAVVQNLHKTLLHKEETYYCLKLDIHKFYPSIDHEILKTIIKKKIKDARLLRLLDNIIDSAPGVPIGNYLSQYFANLYLTYFDHWIKEDKKVKYYFRYADDMVILHNDKTYLHDLLFDMQNYLWDNLRLQVKSNWQIYPVCSRGIDFVGYVFYHTHIRMRKRIKKRFCRKVSRLRKLDLPDKKYLQSICSWTGWAKHCNSKNLLKKLEIRL